MSVAFRCETGQRSAFVRTLAVEARALMVVAGLSACELSLSVVSDDTIQALNRDYRGKDAPTDVLSFSQIEERDEAVAGPHSVPNRRGTVLGDVVISAETALRQAAKMGILPAERMRTLLIHGFLHLLGYDHERSPAEARRMFKRERELAAALEEKMRESAACGQRSTAGRRRNAR